MSDESLPAAGPGTGLEMGPGTRRRRHRFSLALVSVICERIAAGETLLAICRDPEMPCRFAVRAWSREHPAFGVRLAQARIEGRHNPRGGRPTTYHPQVAGLICRRLVGGMTLDEACALPGLPVSQTVFDWIERYPQFADAYRRARMLQAHRRFDQVWEIAQAATPETAYAARVKIEAARWQAAKLAPKRYGPKAEEGDGEGGRPQVNVFIQKFGEDEAVPVRDLGVG